MTKPILTVIIPTFNEEENIVGAIESAKKNIKTPHQIVVWDTASTDKTAVLAEKAGAKVIKYHRIKVVEEIRQKTIDEAKTPWIFLLDADEQITLSLGEKIDETIKEDKADVVAVPRLNYFFGQPLKYAGWWPDYQVKLFKKEALTWPEIVHSKPVFKRKVRFAKFELNSYLIHQNYSSITDFIEKMNRYTSRQAKELVRSHNVTAKDLAIKPFEEFLSRYFFYRGYKGGVLGFAASLLMAFYIFTAYLKAYRLQKHSWQNPSPLENPQVTKKLLHDYLYWRSQTNSQSIFPSLLTKIKLFLLR